MVLEFFFYSLVQSATQAIPVHVSHFHWFKGHMAAYIRPRAVPVKKATESVPSHKQNQNFSLHSVRSKSQQTQKNWRTQSNFFPNPNFFQNRIQANTVKSMAVLRDSILNLHHWTSFLYNSSASSPLEAANSSAIAEASLRRREIEIQRVWTGEEEERKLPIYFRIQAKESTNKTKFKSSWRFQFESPIKTQVNT